MAFDAKSVDSNDWGVMGAAAGVFLFSLFSSYVTLSYDGDDEFLDDVGGGGINAWDSYAVLGLLLLLAVGVLAAARVFADVALPDIGVGWNLVAAGAAALGALLVILRAFTYDVGFFDVGPGWSGYVVMILAVAETAFAVLAFRTSGEQVPWQQRGGSAPPPSAGPPPPAAQPPAAPPPTAPPPTAPPPTAPPPTAPPPTAPPPTAPPPTAPPPSAGSPSAPPPAPPPSAGPPSAPPPG